MNIETTVLYNVQSDLVLACVLVILPMCLNIPEPYSRKNWADNHVKYYIWDVSYKFSVQKACSMFCSGIDLQIGSNSLSSLSVTWQTGIINFKKKPSSLRCFFFFFATLETQNSCTPTHKPMSLTSRGTAWGSWDALFACYWLLLLSKT